MSITMFNKRGDDNLSRIITDNDTTYDNLYDYIEQLFIQNKENINNIRVTVEKNSILTILLDINSTHNKELFIKYNGINNYKIIIVSHYYENGFSLTKTHSERLLSLNNIVFSELLVLLEEYFNYPER